MTELAGEPVSPEMEDFKLQKLIDLGLREKADTTADIGDRAGKEFAIEKQRRRMKQDWEPIASATASRPQGLQPRTLPPAPNWGEGIYGTTPQWSSTSKA